MPAKKVPSKPVDHINYSEIDSGYYANHAQVTLSTNELTIDFFYISPNVDPLMTKKEYGATVKHIQRIITPVSMAKGLADAIVNVVLSYEADHGITLPNARTRQPEDKIDIWALDGTKDE